MPAPEEKPRTGRSALCMRCGRLVILDKFTLCYDCRRDEKQQVDKALDYLKDHRGATLQQIAMATGVDPQLVLKLIQGGRMESSSREKVLKKKKK